MPKAHDEQTLFLSLGYPITSELMTSINQLVLAYTRQFSERLPITVSQFIALDLIERCDGEIVPKEIARELGVQPSAVTHLLNRLEGLDLVSRLTDASNRSSTRVVLRSMASDILWQGRALAEAVVREYMEPLDAIVREKMDSVPGLLARLEKRGFAATCPHGLDFYQASLYCVNNLKAVLFNNRLTITEFRVLFELSQRPQEMIALDLAKALLLRSPNVTATCNSLEDRLLIKRYHSAKDRRILVHDITEQGWLVLRTVAPLVDELFMRLDSGSDKSERELRLRAAEIDTERRRRAFRP